MMSSATPVRATPSDPGVYPKFVVRRTDPDAQVRHSRCFSFVLDPCCDPYAAVAVGSYADACEADQPLLARELRVFATQTAVHTQINSLSAWIDGAQEGRDPEAVTWHRVAKISEELGEAIEALIGCTGANPRKQVSHTVEDLRRELLDVAVSALAAHAHTEGNRANPMTALASHIDAVCRRAGLSESLDGGDDDGPR